MGDTRFLFNGLINERKNRPRKKLRSRTTFHPLVSPLASLLPFPFFSIFFLFFPFLFSFSLFFRPTVVVNESTSKSKSSSPPPVNVFPSFALRRFRPKLFPFTYPTIHPSIYLSRHRDKERDRKRERDYFNPNDGCERARMEEPKE